MSTKRAGCRLATTPKNACGSSSSWVIGATTSTLRRSETSSRTWFQRQAYCASRSRRRVPLAAARATQRPTTSSAVRTSGCVSVSMSRYAKSDGSIGYSAAPKRVFPVPGRPVKAMTDGRMSDSDDGGRQERRDAARTPRADPSPIPLQCYSSTGARSSPGPTSGHVVPAAWHPAAGPESPGQPRRANICYLGSLPCTPST